MNNQDKKLQLIFEQFHFLANEPFKISISLGVVGFAFAFILFGWEIMNNVSRSFGLFLIIINIAIIIGAICFIAYMRQYPKAYSNRVSGQFLFKTSLQMTRFIQRELILPVEASRIAYTAKSQIQKYNNELRLLSFVVVFENESYIFIRMPKNVTARRDIAELEEIADDVVLELGVNKSSFKSLIINKNIGLGYVSRAQYKVMRLA